MGLMHTPSIVLLAHLVRIYLLMLLYKLNTNMLIMCLFRIVYFPRE
jgi:hypothetical protein